MTTYTTDYLVIGSGIAGLSAARVLSNHGQVAVLTKSAVKESNTYYAQGGIAVAMQPEDAPDLHFEDTLEAGAGLCDAQKVKILVEKGPKYVQELIELGANFDRDGDDLNYTQEAAHQRRRILHAGDATGREIEKTLGRALLQTPNITFFAHTAVTQLLTDDAGRCIGCVAKQDGDYVTFSARSVILATGGCCQLYMRNTNPPLATGDGIALAYEIGATVQDMEFIQFHPTTLFLGDKKPISLFLISEAVRGEGGVLRNRHGEAFMGRYHEAAELAPRDIVSRAIYTEMQRTDAFHVFLDLSGISVDVKKRFPTIYERCLTANIDITKEVIPVAPAAHYCIGGVATDEWGQTGVDGLYAAGEVAATGIHGANRLASNSLLEGLVFGARSAQSMIGTALSTIPSVSSQLSPIQKTSYDRSAVLIAKQTIRRVMWEHVGIVRNAAGLDLALSQLNDLGWLSGIESDDQDVIEVKHMHTIATIAAQQALERTESRGAHYRDDYPDQDPDWLRHLGYRGTPRILSS